MHLSTQRDKTMNQLPMSILDSWADFVARVLKSESELAAAMIGHAGELGSARESLVSGVLSRLLPDIYDVGSGEVVDHLGNRSKQIDIVIARRDFPSLHLPSGTRVYLIESVLATIEVKSTLTSETLRQALDNVASVGRLSPNIVAGTLNKIAAAQGLKKTSDGYVHTNPLETGRFDLNGRPPGYIFGFAGYSSSTKDIAAAISSWATEFGTRERLAMRHYPALIATAGCIAWRNAPPYTVSNNAISLIGRDENPLRLLVLHLLYTLVRKIPPTPDSYGLAPNLDAYIQQMRPPSDFEFAVGEAFNRHTA